MGNENTEIKETSAGSDPNEGQNELEKGSFVPADLPEGINDNSNDDEDVAHSDQKILELTEQVDKLNDLILRERADFVNYRKRTLQENLQQEGRIAGKILQEITPVFDAFDLLLASETEGQQSIGKFMEGSRLIQKQLWQVFENLGVEYIDPVNMEFDPVSMEALSVSESEKAEKEMVVQVYQKGYKYKDRILRAARVAVEKPKSQPAG